MEDLQKALNKAKIALMSRPDSAFFTTCCFSLKHLWDATVGTAYTDGYVIGVNPTFFLNLDPEERIFLMLHETLHVAYLHMLRRGDRDPQRWNIAADHVINLQLLERKFKMPKEGLADPAYKGLSVEQVYDLLPPQQTIEIELDIRDSAQPPGELEQHVQDIVVRAAVQAKIQGDTPGSIPGEIQLFLDKLLNPKLPWQRILQKYVQSYSKSDYTWRTPNRRFFPDHHLPSLHSESLIDLAIAVDISGSVSDKEFQHFVSEAAGILRMMKPNKISLIQFDTEIKSIDEVRTLQELSQITFTGRGGTCIVPVLTWAAEKKPQLLLVFSDGFFHFYTQEHKSRILWLIHNNPQFAAPFGKVIHYEMEL